MRRLTLTLLMATLALAITACGNDDPNGSGPVTALNVESGKKKSFSSPGAVPPGWIPCPTPSCTSLPPHVPCANLSPAVCPLNPTCEVEQVCNAGSACASGPNGQPGNCPPTTKPKCYKTCQPKKRPSSCDAIRDAKKCGARSDCQWQQMACPMYCPAGGPCPPCTSGICTAKRPPSCSSLDRTTCTARSDCDWRPGPCPMCIGPNCSCPAFCQDKGPVGCPSIAPTPPDFCKGGKVISKYDRNGCVIGFDCLRGCPAVGLVPPPCTNGKLVPKYDANGCLLRYECDNGSTGSCADLSNTYAATLAKARQCNPSLPTLQCTTLVDTQLACPCSTYVNAGNTTALQKLNDLKKKWQAQGCGSNTVCPAVLCMPAAKASCGGTGTSGTCNDSQP